MLPVEPISKNVQCICALLLEEQGIHRDKGEGKGIEALAGVSEHCLKNHPVNSGSSHRAVHPWNREAGELLSSFIKALAIQSRWSTKKVLNSGRSFLQLVWMLCVQLIGTGAGLYPGHFFCADAPEEGDWFCRAEKTALAVGVVVRVISNPNVCWWCGMTPQVFDGVSSLHSDFQSPGAPSPALQWVPL